MPVDLVEELIEDEYRTIALSPELRDSIEQLILEDFDTLQAAAADERKDLEAQRTTLTAQRQKLLDARYAGAIPIDLLKQNRTASPPSSATSSSNSALPATATNKAARPWPTAWI
jgi:site-specific DNA recombinase